MMLAQIHMVQKSVCLGTLQRWAVAFCFAFGLSVWLSARQGIWSCFVLESPLCECWCVACVALLLSQCINAILIWLGLLLTCLLLHYCLAACLCLLLYLLSCLRVYKKWSKTEANQGINPQIPRKCSITCLGYKITAYYRRICAHLDFPVSCPYDFSLSA
jgi:hypothetical protein